MGVENRIASGPKVGTPRCCSFLVIANKLSLHFKSSLPSLALQTLFGKFLHIEGTTGIRCYYQTEMNNLDAKSASRVMRRKGRELRDYMQANRCAMIHILKVFI